MAKKSSGKTTKKSSGQTKKSPAPRYRINKKGKIVGPDGKNVADTLGDTPIVISGGSLLILSAASLDDDDNPGQQTRQLHAQDMTKHVTSIQLIGFKPDTTSPNRFVPSNSSNPVCTIIVHYG
jgi:hypothetical protein